MTKRKVKHDVNVVIVNIFTIRRCWLAVNGKPVLCWKCISGLKLPCFLFYAC